MWREGLLYESTGLFGRSQVRMLDLTTGAVRKSTTLPQSRFGEGLAFHNGRLHQLTWRNQIGYVYDPATLILVDSFSYRGEGWGLATDGRHLIRSDGTDTLRFFDPLSNSVIRKLAVRFPSQVPVTGLNELEFINGELFANVYRSDWIVRVNPATGIAADLLDFGRLPPEGRGHSITQDDLNGIAYDEMSGHLMVTGKRWRAIFVIVLERPPGIPAGQR